jgi:hypothetical protein
MGTSGRITAKVEYGGKVLIFDCSLLSSLTYS